MEIIKSKVNIRLTCTEDEAFIKVLSILEKIGQDVDGNEFGRIATDGTPTSSLYKMLSDFFQACI